MYNIRYFLRDGGLLLDIRSKEEYDKEHLSGAINVPTPLPPLTSNEKKVLQEKLRRMLFNFEKNVPILLYCKKGIRAKIAAEILRNMRYTNVIVLGGMKDISI